MEFLNALWKFLTLSAPYLLFGLLIASVLNHFVTVEKIKSLFGGSKLAGVLKASLLGVPLPLCSCSVIPVAVTLKKNGASNGATSSFLISTPESGVDSIMVTYGMMDPVMTIVRPISAFLSAFIAGVLQIVLKTDIALPVEEEVKKSCCAGEKKKQDSVVKKIVKYAYSDLLEDFALWLTFGILLGAMVDIFVPADMFSRFDGFSARIVFILIGVPVYICASASTPIAASLILKGLSPGTALILLLVGPATNLSNLLVLQKYMGKKAVIVNVIAISLAALALSFGVDFIYSYYNLPLDFKISHEHEHSNWFVNATTVLFVGLLLHALWKKEILPRVKGKKNGCS
ncbi:MAG: SO_0444 family Cu/Zn efflux transporter [Bacteriovoracaceae bacterium]|nr:SO_0444 family Cu/Zn efflux transporter [Bacteriovoracaceae bacterium]